MREQILTFLEKNSKIDLGELAILLGSSEAVIANEVAQMEKEQVICGYHTLIDWEKTSSEKVTALIEVRDRKSTRLNSSHRSLSRMPSSA